MKTQVQSSAKRTVYRPRMIYRNSKHQGWLGNMYIVSEAQWKRIEEKPYASHWVLSSIGCGYLCVFRRIRRMTFAEIETGLGCKLPEDAREPYYNAGWSK